MHKVEQFLKKAANCVKGGDTCKCAYTHTICWYRHKIFLEGRSGEGAVLFFT